MPSTTDPSAWEPSVESPPCETLAPAGLTIDLEQVVGQLNVNLFWSSYSNFSPPGNVPEMRGKPLHIARWVRRIEKGSEAIAPLLRKKRQRHLGRIWKTRYAPPRTRFRTCLRAKMGEARAHKHHMTTQMLLKELTATFREEEKKRRPINKQFAEMTDKRWSKKLDPEEVSNLLAKYDWLFLNAFKRKTDLRFANIQQALKKSSFATLKNAGTLIKICDLSAPTSRVDVVALLGQAASELSVLRREQLKPSLKPEFHALFSSETMSSQKLPIVKEKDQRCQRNPSSWKEGRLL